MPAILAVGGLLAAGSVLAAAPTIEASALGPYGYSWSPSSAQIAAGGSVNFKNGSTTTSHGVAWTGGPATPSCTGVPINTTSTNWSGSCTYPQAGTYSFKCPLHSEMTGSITVTSGGTGGETPPPTTPPGTPPPGESGPAAHDLRVAGNQHSTSVRGSIEIADSAAGSKLDVALLARRAALFGPRHGGTTRVGHLVRASTGVGHAAFAVRLTTAARNALQDAGRLRITVRVVVTPPTGSALTFTRSIVVKEEG